MARSCSICTHPERDAIDRALVAATPKRRIAAECGINKASVRRHAAAHLPGALVKASVIQEVARADDLLGLARRLQHEALDVLEHAKADGNLGGVLQAIDRLQKGTVLLTSLLEAQEPAGPTTFADLARRAAQGEGLPPAAGAAGVAR